MKATPLGYSFCRHYQVSRPVAPVMRTFTQRSGHCCKRFLVLFGIRRRASRLLYLLLHGILSPCLILSHGSTCSIFDNS
ncbi:uncharacterized protein STEHIDRAFT_134794 [Stereum hirsutum FP-91666 SS1]|uniref:uncharacterized protein n=1 Tax=Stereum hirsutum (strain FP-91666) TaxID=721885 RepID=UPI0004449248|nr:uncharacterized protein STEHIDRAFT_134794 [Stereum hirsutum FP-91666 SS1]EIM81158.1 hypothetical protein STEHIDRAFT_134794 [Stereum hirsutum FP-91666 SS1]